MTRLFLATLVLVALGLPSAPAAAPPPAGPTFKEKADAVIVTIAMHSMETRIVLTPEAIACWDHAGVLKSFHEELCKELSSTDPSARLVALDYLETLAVIVRSTAWHSPHEEGDDHFRLALGRHAGPIRSRLEALLKEATPKERLSAAVALLALSPTHQPAIHALVAQMKAGNPRRREKACAVVGKVWPQQAEVIAALASALDDADHKVRNAAVRSLWGIGPRAAQAAPGMIRLLQRGIEVEEEVKVNAAPFPATRPFQRPRNVVLLALAQMGEAARPAVGLLAAQLAKADQKRQEELLTCLAHLGPVAAQAAPQVRHLLSTTAGRQRLFAAATLLCIDYDPKASRLLVAALTGDDKETLAQALEACAELGPKTEDLLLPLAAVVKKGDEQARIKAAGALGKMGPLAGPAVPALGKMLADTGPAGHESLRWNLAAAYALASIGKAGLPPSLGVLRQPKAFDPLLATFFYLPEMREQKAEIVPALLEAVKESCTALAPCKPWPRRNTGRSFPGMKWLQQVCLASYAAVALGRLRPADPEATNAVRQLHALRDRLEEDCQVLVVWALQQLEG
jgi:HEAT repeat protein